MGDISCAKERIKNELPELTQTVRTSLMTNRFILHIQRYLKFVVHSRYIVSDLRCIIFLLPLEFLALRHSLYIFESAT